MTSPIASTCAYFPRWYCKDVKGTINEVKDTLKLYGAFRSICVSSIGEFKCWVFSLIISTMKYRNHKETTVSETMAFDPWLPAVWDRAERLSFTLPWSCPNRLPLAILSLLLLNHQTNRPHCRLSARYRWFLWYLRKHFMVYQWDYSLPPTEGMFNNFVKVIRLRLQLIKSHSTVAQSKPRCSCFLCFNKLFTRGHIQLVISLLP